MDLYEQCSLHIALNMPSSTKFGWRFRRERILSYSSVFIRWVLRISGVIVKVSLCCVAALFCVVVVILR